MEYDACAKWFVHENDPDFDFFGISNGGGAEPSDGDVIINVPRSSELRTSFWSEHESTFVPLEITTSTTRGAAAFLPHHGSITGDGEGDGEGFERIEAAPLKILIANLSKPPASNSSQADGSNMGDMSNMSIYLAQCDLSSLPQSLQSDVPIPKLLLPSSSNTTSTIKGDIYSSSLWLGRPPTYTPFHRDPNPNLFIQLTGRKTIRLLPPAIGDAIYHELVTTRLFSPTSTSTSTSFSTAIRGEEMMVGPQKTVLHDAIWNQDSIYSELVRTHGLQTTLGLGDALFTPKGWWHSVKGVGQGVTASVNWWFR
ncbi:uncharacterized protein Z520_08709 [Fonsecaea multimorphosa CBS 102226]|uniref:JmjC domain-containing protein n=1 Tax=Fonsecaea multimorphosa CBS 102226 TaxID=1442371 RepID=A0A0D2JYF1_9EURO|nr:uncharacterized protein Z520_08709 [Fonsecaea multimorphosa CBS 102226]KIX95589.1 hypothetical protein Z520_08709 [Fonsecaea multimorphosa CBS 102226]OAL21195.1 hypothetical protein AYO22_08158 [Fonsecaea multimorphosa]